MRGVLRFLLWAALLAYPCFLFARPYQALLIGATGLVLGIPIAAPPGASPDLAASNVLGIFLAMCLASNKTPWHARLGLATLGCLGMGVTELASGFAGLLLAAQDVRAATGSAVSPSTIATVLEMPRFFMAPLLWLVLLGRWELPVAMVGVSQSGRAHPTKHR